MWDTLRSAPRGRVYTRNFVMFFATLLVASFVYIFSAAPTAYAVDATWDGDAISYDSKTFTGPVDTAGKRGLSAIPDGAQLYQTTQKTGSTTTAYIIYFPSGGVPKSSKEATYITYTLNPPNQYSNPSSPTTISLAAATAEEPDTDEGPLSNCTVGGIGWIVCPTMRVIAEGMDTIYGLVSSFLVVQPLSNSADSPIYRAWSAMRDLANVAFIIAIMIIVYSQLTSVGISNYNIKKMLPRIIIAAILVNISYIVCAGAVDISNILGSSINSLFEYIRDDLLPGSDRNHVTWESVTAFLLSGGAIAGAGLAGFSLAATAVGSAGGLWIAILPFLLGGFLVVIVTFLILAARQAIILILIIIAPLAFVAYLLPNTEKWFERWQKTLFTMLVMFPAFAVVFGGAQLAGELIIRAAVAQNALIQVILGLGVMIAPLAITPLLLKLGGGLLNRFAGIVNNPQKGLMDRYKNHNRERLADFRAKQDATNAKRRADGTMRKREFVRRTASRNYAKKNFRETQRKADEERAQNEWHRDKGQYGYDNQQGRDDVRKQVPYWRGKSVGIRGTSAEGYGNLDTQGRDNKLFHGQTEADHEEHWQKLVQRDPVRRAMLKDTKLSEGRGKLVEGAMASDDEQALQEEIRDTPTLRNLRVRTVVSSGLAEDAKKLVEGQGQHELQETILASTALRDQARKIHEYEGRANQARELIDDGSKAAWEELTLTDRTIYSRQLERQGNAKKLKSLQDEWESILVEASAGRTDDYQTKFGPVTGAVSASIDTIQVAEQSSATEALRKERGDQIAKVNLNKSLKSNAALLQRAGGIDPEGKDKVLAQLQQESSALHMKNVEAARSIFTNDKRYTNDTLRDVYEKGVLADGVTQATITQRHAAMQRIAMETGNNYAVQDLIDFTESVGYHEDGGVYKDKYGNALTDEEIDTRRDFQQIARDAVSKSGNKVNWFTGTDQGMAENGRYLVRDPNGNLNTNLAASELAIVREINAGKVDNDKAFMADIDVIDKQVNSLRLDEVNTFLDPTGAQQYAEKLTEFLSDPLTGRKLDARKRGSYHVLLAELNALAGSDTRSASVRERQYQDVVSGNMVDILPPNLVSRKPRSRRPSGPVQLS